MEEISTLLSAMPAWVSSIPTWGLFLTVVGSVIIAYIRVWPRLRELGINERFGIRQPYLDRIIRLEEALAECEKKCDEREGIYKEEIDRLKTKINNEAWQRVQSEISLVSTLVQVLPSPELKIVLDALQKRSASLPASITAVGGPVEDSEKGSD